MNKRNYLKSRLYSLFIKPNRDAILLFGLNKSGTTVAINLISKRAGLTFLDDFPYHLGNFDKVISGQMSLTQYIDKFSYAFSRDMIRFPTDKHSLDLAKKYYNKNKYLLVVRHPIDNIKSNLSRLKIPGDLEHLNVGELNIHPLWKKMLTKDEDYIVSLAKCWHETYNQFDFDDPNCVLFRYEKFKENKIYYITEIVEKLDLVPKNPIDQYVHVQYQPKGTVTHNESFFGNENMNKITKHVAPLAQKLGYTL